MTRWFPSLMASSGKTSTTYYHFDSSLALTAPPTPWTSSGRLSTVQRTHLVSYSLHLGAGWLLQWYDPHALQPSKETWEGAVVLSGLVRPWQHLTAGTAEVEGRTSVLDRASLGPGARGRPFSAAWGPVQRMSQREEEHSHLLQRGHLCAHEMVVRRRHCPMGSQTPSLDAAGVAAAAGGGGGGDVGCR